MTDPTQHDPLLRHDEAADLLRMAAGTLYQHNHRGTGPRRIRLGGRLVYRRSDLDAWLAAREVPTVEPVA